MKKVLVLYGSSREQGNTEYLTEWVLDHTPNVNVEKIYLRNTHIKPIKDERHSGKLFPNYKDDYNQISIKMMQADILIFATPVYWYNMSSLTKLFVDRWTESLRGSNVDMKKQMTGKSMYVICTGANPDETVVHPMIGVFKLMAKYFDMKFKGYLWVNADRPGDIKSRANELEYAKNFIDKDLRV